MSDLCKPSEIKSLLDRHGFRFSKALGQNFIINPSVCPKMAAAALPHEGINVLEIGPGIGVLTRELALRAKKVVSVELDERLLPILAETLAEFSHVKIIGGDILKIDLHALIREEFGDEPVVVCANLPYYVTSPILMYLLESRAPFESITVMVQKEAAERITAKPGTRAAGAISIAVRFRAEPKILFDVPPGSFMPPPSVTSSVIHLDVLKNPPVDVFDEEEFFRTVRAAFSKRRKMLRSGLGSSLGLSKEHVAAALEAAGVPGTARPEELTLEMFAALAAELYR